MMTPSGHPDRTPGLTPGTGRGLPGRNAARIALVLGAAAVGTTLLASPAAAAASTPSPTAATAGAATTAVRAVTAARAIVKTAPAPAAKSPVKPAVPVQTKAQKVIALAKQYSGRAYRWGAAGPSAFDCTGYTQYIYKKVGVKLPHSGAQGSKGKKVARKSARPGDLVVFRDAAGRVFHVGIYAGGNKMYDAPTYGKKTGLHHIWSSHVEFRRLV